MTTIRGRKVLTDTSKLTREEWLEYRRKGIGGSDAGAIVGMNPWASPYTVWADKLGKLPPKEDTESMRIGRDLAEGEIDMSAYQDPKGEEPEFMKE